MHSSTDHAVYERLREVGELHCTLESGAEAHLHRHDVTLSDRGTLVIDSREGRWEFAPDRIESIEEPDSHLDPP